jgi:hypothetical protein
MSIRVQLVGVRGQPSYIVVLNLLPLAAVCHAQAYLQPVVGDNWQPSSVPQPCTVTDSYR